MKKMWHEHQLLFILTFALMTVLITGTWATYYEYSHNEQGYPEDHHAFFSWVFFAYWWMQLLMNYAPELMGTITVVILAAKFNEKFKGMGDE